MTRRSGYLGRLTLRGRTIAVFGAVALALSAVIAVSVWFSVTGYLLGQRERSATVQAIDHAEQLTAAWGAGMSAPVTELGRLPRTIGSSSLLRLEGRSGGDRWFTSSLAVGRDIVPTRMQEDVADGTPVRQRLEVDGQPMLVVGIPLAVPAAGYFEVFPLEELEQTLMVLSTVLVASVAIFPVGTMLLGSWVLGPALRPLDRVTVAVRAVAAGELSARLDHGGDPALVPIAASFNQTADALERRVRVDAQFAADVSHELRSPLTAMMGAVSVMAEHRRSVPAEVSEMIGLLQLEVARFAQLVDDLLEMSRLDAGSADLSLDDVALAELVEHTVPPQQRHLFKVTEAARDVIVTVDKRRMERVLTNLLDNAERHGEGLTGVVVDADGTRGLVLVEDRGPGLAPHELERIFDRFARSRRSPRDSTAGAGLGLSLVARHLRLMDGSINVDNRDGGGVRFIVAVPVSTTGKPVA